jgi:hypothetical protein
MVRRSFSPAPLGVFAQVAVEAVDPHAVPGPLNDGPDYAIRLAKLTAS